LLLEIFYLHAKVFFSHPALSVAPTLPSCHKHFFPFITMKNFLPIASPSGDPWETMRLSLQCLDDKRLGKQRCESLQMLQAIQGTSRSKGWRVHPATHAWRGYAQALGTYIKLSCEIWASRTNKKGEPFSNARMDEHIVRLHLGRNDDGVEVALSGVPAIMTLGPQGERYADGIQIPW
jgi:hypothetical protein